MPKLPTFADEKEEAAFWESHDSAEYADELHPVDMTFVDARPPKVQISLRLDPEIIDQLKDIARRKGIGYQTLIRLWVMERLAVEQ